MIESRTCHHASRRRTGSRTTRQGSVAVEFAFALPVLLAIALGTVEFSLARLLETSVNDATRNACEAAASAGVSDEMVHQIVEDSLTLDGYDSSQVRIVTLVNGSAKSIATAQFGDLITIQVSVSTDALSGTRFFAALLNDGWIESRTTMMRL